MITPQSALLNIRPGAQWAWSGKTYEGLNWLDQEQTKPTVQEINTEIERLKQEELDKYYQQLRVQEYPPLSEFADAMYWQNHGDSTKMTAYLAACEAVKQKYPKDMEVPQHIQDYVNSIELLPVPEEDDNA
jgi:hypothetical protein